MLIYISPVPDSQGSLTNRSAGCNFSIQVLAYSKLLRCRAANIKPILLTNLFWLNPHVEFPDQKQCNGVQELLPSASCPRPLMARMGEEWL
jgi:hypothetical protein